MKFHSMKFYQRTSNTSPSLVDDLFFYLVVPICCVAVIAHCIGLLTIYKYKRRTNQNLILASLSISEIFVAIDRLINEALWYLVANKQVKVPSPIIDTMIPVLAYTTIYGCDHSDRNVRFRG